METEFKAALAGDLAQLIRLHDRELDPATVDALKAVNFPQGLALLPGGESGALGLNNMAAAVAELDTSQLDLLAADFAAIYLNNRYSTSPCESVWLSDEHLACERPMFELREIYAAAGLQPADRGQRFDDHLVLQLHYLAHALSRPTVDGVQLAKFIDEHLGYWFPEFAQRVSLRCASFFYAALAELTHCWLINFRQLLADFYDQAVVDREIITQRIQRKLALDKAEIAPIRFMPGAQGPSW